MISQHGSRGANPYRSCLFSPEFALELIEVRKKRLDETVQFLAVGSQHKGPALEKDYAKGVLELRNLAADCWLLNSVRNVADRLHDAAIASDIVKQFQVMDVHAIRPKQILHQLNR